MCTKRRSARIRGQHLVGHDEIRAALLAMGLVQPRRPRHEYDETHVVDDCAFALWNQRPGRRYRIRDDHAHGADFYRFRDGNVAAKIACRKNR